MEFDEIELAQELDRARRTAEPVELLTARFPSLTWEQARSVARSCDELQRGRGERLIGYKLGWTSAQMREALGIDRPNWGTLWTDQLLADGVLGDQVLDCTAHIHPKVEPELVYRCGRDLDPSVSAEEVVATGEWALGLEVVDPRFPSFDFDWLDNTADNSSSGAVAIGEFVAEAGPPDEITVAFSEGNERRDGLGANALGNPAEAVRWLVQQLAAEGDGLVAGNIVFTGGLTAPFDVTPGARFELTSPALPSISLIAR